MANILEGVLLGIENPLLDISAHVGTDLFEKYDVKPGNACLAEPKHLPLYDELVKNYQVDYIAGGACQNSVRACQWMLQVPHATGYIGCVGNDENGKRLKQAAESYGMDTHYLVDSSKPTGTCAVLIHDKERSLIANLGAAEAYKEEHFQSKEIQDVVNKAQFFYSTGFFLTHSAKVAKALGEYAAKTNKHFLFNLAAPFVIEYFWDALSSVLPYADAVFCNETEAQTLGKKCGWGENLDEIATKLAEFPKENKSRTRTVIFTQGAKQTIVFHEGKLHHFTPIKLNPSEIVDLNGAGDSFVGGFLSRFVQNKSIPECVTAGHYCACECIKQSGCTFPPKPNFVYQQ